MTIPKGPYKRYTLKGIRRVLGPGLDINICHMTGAGILAAVLNVAYNHGRRAAKRRITSGR